MYKSSLKINFGNEGIESVRSGSGSPPESGANKKDTNTGYEAEYQVNLNSGAEIRPAHYNGSESEDLFANAGIAPKSSCLPQQKKLGHRVDITQREIRPRHDSDLHIPVVRKFLKDEQTKHSSSVLVQPPLQQPAPARNGNGIFEKKDRYLGHHETSSLDPQKVQANLLLRQHLGKLQKTSHDIPVHHVKGVQSFKPSIEQNINQIEEEEEEVKLQFVTAKVFGYSSQTSPITDSFSDNKISEKRERSVPRDFKTSAIGSSYKEKKSIFEQSNSVSIELPNNVIESVNFVPSVNRAPRASSLPKDEASYQSAKTDGQSTVPRSRIRSNPVQVVVENPTVSSQNVYERKSLSVKKESKPRRRRPSSKESNDSIESESRNSPSIEEPSRRTKSVASPYVENVQLSQRSRARSTEDILNETKPTEKKNGTVKTGCLADEKLKGWTKSTSDISTKQLGTKEFKIQGDGSARPLATDQSKAQRFRDMFEGKSSSGEPARLKSVSPLDQKSFGALTKSKSTQNIGKESTGTDNKIQKFKNVFEDKEKTVEVKVSSQLSRDRYRNKAEDMGKLKSKFESQESPNVSKPVFKTTPLSGSTLKSDLKDFKPVSKTPGSSDSLKDDPRIISLQRKRENREKLKQNFKSEQSEEVTEETKMEIKQNDLKNEIRIDEQDREKTFVAKTRAQRQTAIDTEESKFSRMQKKFSSSGQDDSNRNEVNGSSQGLKKRSKDINKSPMEDYETSVASPAVEESIRRQAGREARRANAEVKKEDSTIISKEIDDAEKIKERQLRRQQRLSRRSTENDENALTLKSKSVDNAKEEIVESVPIVESTRLIKQSNREERIMKEKDNNVAKPLKKEKENDKILEKDAKESSIRIRRDKNSMKGTDDKTSLESIKVDSKEQIQPPKLPVSPEPKSLPTKQKAISDEEQPPKLPSSPKPSSFSIKPQEKKSTDPIVEPSLVLSKDPPRKGFSGNRLKAKLASLSTFYGDEGDLEPLPKPASTFPKDDNTDVESQTLARKESFEKDDISIEYKKEIKAEEVIKEVPKELETLDRKESVGIEKLTKEIETTQKVEEKKEAIKEEKNTVETKKKHIKERKPVFIIKPRRQFVEAGGTAKFRTSFDGEPQPECLWEKSGDKLENGDKYKIHNVDDYYYLEVLDVSHDDKDTYSCVLSNTAGKTQISAELEVYGKAKTKSVSSSKTTSVKKVIETKEKNEEKNLEKEATAVKEPLVQEVKKTTAPPKLMTPLEDKTACDGDKITFECHITGDPEPVVTWMYNGKRLKEAKDLKQSYDGKVAKLTFLEVFPEDEGVYDCIARNDDGEVKTTAKLFVTETEPEPVLSPPKFVQELKDQTVQDGDKVVMKCSLETPVGEGVEMKWLKSGKVIKECSDFKMTFDGEKTQLEIVEVYPEDEGVIECVARNAAGEATTKATLKVEELPEEEETPQIEVKQKPAKEGPKFTQCLQDMVVYDGDRVEFTVELSGSEPIEACWYHGKNDIKTGDVYQIVKEGLVHKLIIPEVYPEDAGLYICEIFNAVGDDDCKCKLTVKEKENETIPVKDDKGGEKKIHDIDETYEPEFLRKPKSVNIDEGNPANFSCKIDANPPATLTWSKDDKIIENGGRFKVWNEKDSYYLEISHSLATDSGKYDVEISNTVGSEKHSVNLIVKPLENAEYSDFRSLLKSRPSLIKIGDSSSTESEKEAEQHDFRNLLTRHVNTKKRPEVVKDLQDIKAKEGEEVTLECGITGIPPPKIAWYLGKKEIKESKYFKMTYEGDSAKLVIAEAYPEDEGEYTCEGKNSSGIAKSTCDVYVQDTVPDSPRERKSQCSDMAEPPFIEDLSPDNIHILRGKTVQLKGKFLGEPTVQWFKGKTEIVSGDRIKVSVVRDITTLTIDAVESDDSGRYSLLIENDLGRDSCSSSVTVEDIPNAPAGKPAACNISDDALTLSWYGPSYDGGSHVTDYRVEMRTADETEWKTLTSTCKNTSFQIKDLHAYTEYIFRVSVANKHGFSPAGKESDPIVTVDRRCSNKTDSSDGGNLSDNNLPPESPFMLSQPLSPAALFAARAESHLTKTQKADNPILHKVPEVDSQYLNALSDLDFLTVPESLYVLSSPLSPDAFRAARDEMPFTPRDVCFTSEKKFTDFYDKGMEIGKGRFGDVYLCTDKSTKREFAAKFIKTKVSQKEEFKQEVAIMNELHHPKLLLLWDAFESTREIVLVMEHVAGGELFERIIDDDYSLTERECIHFMRQICEGVRFMHLRNILHLDLKPENILCITPNSNEIKIIDFGLARKYDPKKATKVMFGTAEFVAPEVINYDEISLTTDMWSVGVICYILLSGLSPFSGENNSETLANVTMGTYDFDDEAFDVISDDAKDFIESTLHKNQRKRLSSESCLAHRWLSQDVKFMRAKRLSTEKHKRYMARRKWQKTGNAIRALGRMASLQKGMLAMLGGEGKEHSLNSSARSDSGFSTSTELSNMSPLKTRSLPRNMGLGKLEKGLKILDTNCNTVQEDNSYGKLSDLSSDCSKDTDSETGSTANIDPPKLITKMKNCEVFEGDNARFFVQIEGDSETTVTWFLEDKEIKEDKRHVMTFDDLDMHSLVIKDCCEVDDALYTCKAKNSAGEVSCTGELFVELDNES